MTDGDGVSGNVLLIGYGNPGRRDDGLGPALASAVEELGIPGVTTDADYQLNVEDAEAVARYDYVVFADADVSGPEPFSFRKLEPDPSLGFTTHSVKPGALLALASELFGGRPEAYVLAIRGYEFGEFEESLSAGARANLAAALTFIEPLLRRRSFRDAVDAVGKE